MARTLENSAGKLNVSPPPKTEIDSPGTRDWQLLFPEAASIWKLKLGGPTFVPFASPGMSGWDVFCMRSWAKE